MAKGLILTDPERNGILAALRHWQSLPQADRDNDPIASDGIDEAAVLDEDDIDRLCQKVNSL